MSPAESPPDPAEDQGVKSGRERRLIAWLGLLAVLLGTVIGAAALFNQGAVFGGASKSTGRVVLAEEVVRNSRYDSDDVGLHGTQTIASSPTVDLTLLNSTGEPVLVTKVAFTVLASTRVPLCFTQGGGDVAANAPETIVLPSASGHAGGKLTRDLHHFVPAHGLERFLFRFTTSEFGESYSLYELGFELTTSTGQTLDGGKIVVAAPAAVPRGGQYFPVEDSILAQAQRNPHLDSTWCFRHNVAAARRATRWPGKRSFETQALATLTPVRRWSKFKDPLPARQAALKLASLGVSYADDAVFAAQATHDPSFVQSVRRRCARALLNDARSSLRSGFPEGALERAKQARDLFDTPEANQVIGESERRIGH